MAEADFLNACSPDTCLSFSTPFDSGAMLRTPPVVAGALVARASATSMCKDLVPLGKQVMYIAGSSDFAALLQELAPVIVNTINIVPVFQTTSSCTGVRSMNPESPTYATDHYIKDPITTTETFAQLFLGDDTPPVSCLLGAGGVALDLGESEIAQDTCGGPANPPDLVGEALGPILPIVFAVPKLSSQKTISAAAAQQVFGGGGGVPPWEDPAFLYIRGQGTATLRLVAKEIGVLPNQFWGTDQGSGSSMARNLSAAHLPCRRGSGAGNAEHGRLRSADSPGLRQGTGLSGPWPVVRLPARLVADQPGQAQRARRPLPALGAHSFLLPALERNAVVAGRGGVHVLFSSPVLDPEILSAIVNSGMVPPCAMKVRRVSDLGDFTYFDPPPVACGCAFDAQVGIDPLRAECTTCTSNSDCPQNRPVCRYGYCEQEAN